MCPASFKGTMSAPCVYIVIDERIARFFFLFPNHCLYYVERTMAKGGPLNASSRQTRQTSRLFFSFRFVVFLFMYQTLNTQCYVFNDRYRPSTECSGIWPPKRSISISSNSSTPRSHHPTPSTTSCACSTDSPSGRLGQRPTLGSSLA